MASTIYRISSNQSLIMKQEYRISIIVPVFNVEQYIKRCIESIIAQEIKDVLMECLLIDDCSPDNSITIAKQTLHDYNGNIYFKFHKHDYNRGLSAARNTGIQAAKGDYILFIDSDDYLKPQSLFKMLKALDANPIADSVVANYYDCKEKKVPFPIEQLTIANNRDDIMRLFYNIKIKNAAWNKLVSRKQIIQNQIYFVEGLLNEDVLWSYKQYSTSNSMVLIPDVTYIYEYNPQSIVNTTVQKAHKNIDSFLYISANLMNEPYQGHFVDFMLFTFSYIVKALFLMQTYGATNEQKERFCFVRKKIIISALKRRRIILCSFFLLLYKPLSLLLNYSFFRNLYDRQSKIIALLAKYFNFAHKKR